jgi:hypothetical protein
MIFSQPSFIMFASSANGVPSMFRAFTDHPATVGESYFEHMRTASWFAITMLVGSVACLIHAILPFACQKSGSRRIKLLHERMVTHRHRAPETQGFLGYAEGI